jgi:F-type H+-transporting ATPase subunit delta
MKNVKQIKRDARQLLRLCLVDGLLDEDRVRQVVRQVIEANRRGGPALLSRFLYLVKLDRDRHSARVESAAPLPADLQASIKSDLARTYGPGISASFEQNPALIGGMRVKVGSDVFDGSVRGALDALEKNFQIGGLN